MPNAQYCDYTTYHSTVTMPHTTVLWLCHIPQYCDYTTYHSTVTMPHTTVLWLCHIPRDERERRPTNTYVDPMLDWCYICDAGPTSIHLWVNVSCLLGHEKVCISGRCLVAKKHFGDWSNLNTDISGYQHDQHCEWTSFSYLGISSRRLYNLLGIIM